MIHSFVLTEVHDPQSQRLAECVGACPIEKFGLMFTSLGNVTSRNRFRPTTDSILIEVRREQIPSSHGAVKSLQKG